MARNSIVSSATVQVLIIIRQLKSLKFQEISNTCSWFYSFITYLLKRDEKVSKKCTSHNSIETRQLLIKEVGLFLIIGKVLLKCSQFTFIIDIFEDNHNIDRDHFQTNSVNVMKNRLVVVKNTRKFQFISTWLSHINKPQKSPLGTNNAQNALSHTGLRQTVEKIDDLEKYWVVIYQ